MNNSYNFPLFKTFEVSDTIVDFLNSTLGWYRSANDNHHNPNFEGEDCFRTGNLVLWDDSEFNKFSDTALRELYSEHLGIEKDKFEFTWACMLDYGSGATMGLHKHMHNEDFGIVIYLNDCDDGQTDFFLNDYNMNSLMRTKISITPQKGFAACFSSMVFHEGSFSTQNKKMFVSGMKFKE